jgi:protein involved in polysaccharide export with SLBB domain
MAELANGINQTLNRFTLAPGDEIEVVFPRQQEWNHLTRIRPDGKAAFLYLDDQQVVGVSLEDLDRMLTAAYTPKVSNPQIADLTVFLREMGLREVMVIGEVEEPGPVPLLEEPIPLVEALGRAGGPLKRTAKLESTILVRRSRDSGKHQAWKLDASVEQWGTNPGVLVQAGDVVFVPNTNIDDVNIWVDQWIRQMIPLPGFTPYPY